MLDLKIYIQSNKQDRLVCLIELIGTAKKKYSILKENEKINQIYSIGTNQILNKDEFSQLIEKLHVDNYRNKALHGQFINGINMIGIDLKGTWDWLKSSKLKIETESLIIAAHEQALNTRYFQKKILKKKVIGTCRMCHRHVESISHIVSACSMLAPTEYTKRHNKLAGYIHWMICKNFQIETNPRYYEHQPQTTISTTNWIYSGTNH